jgi:lipoprotein-releasing system permease protein
LFRSFLSWRYLRRRRTNLIGIVGIFVAVGALIMILSIMNGFLDESRKTLRGTLSDLIITPYAGSPVMGSRVPREPQLVLDAVREDPRVEACAAHLVWFCIVAGDETDPERILSSSQFGQYAGVKLVGIDLENEVLATELLSSLTAEPKYGARVADPYDPFAPPPGYDPTLGRPRARVVLGEQLFRAHHLYRGAKINLMTARPDAVTGELDASNREFIVAGTFRSGENEMDLDRIYMERDQLARFLAGYSEDEDLPRDALRYTEILVKLKDYDADGIAVRDDLQRRLVDDKIVPAYSTVKTWEEFRQLMLGAIKNERALMAIMLSLVLLVAGFTIFAILSMMVTEKRRDIGILTALGATPRGVLMMFLMIGFWDALIGTVLGAVAGTWAAIEIDAIERWLSNLFGVQIFDRSVYLFDHIPSVVDPLGVTLIVAGAFVCALLFAAIPAWKAASMDPLDALRYE